jgi:Nucleotidyl transferase of unknown function (DUF2204)
LRSAAGGRGSRNERCLRARPDGQLEQALRDLAAVLSASDARWMIIGGIAVIARGVRRFTSDIDAAIRGDEIDVSTLIRALAKKRIVPRISHAKAFALENLVLLLRHEPSGVEFDVSFAWTTFEHEAIAAATVAPFGTVEAPMAQPEDLIVFKSIAGRGKDIDDVTALLALYPKVALARIRARVRELAAAADTPELAAGLEIAIAAAANVATVAKPSRSTAKGATTKPHSTRSRASTTKPKRTAKTRPTTKQRRGRIAKR